MKHCTLLSLLLLSGSVLAYSDPSRLPYPDGDYAGKPASQLATKTEDLRNATKRPPVIDEATTAPGQLKASTRQPSTTVKAPGLSGNTTVKAPGAQK